MPDTNPAVEHFRKNMSQVYKQAPINEADFLRLCQEAVELVFAEWKDREIIASRIAQIFLRHRDELSPSARGVGDFFADLELPDSHIHNPTGLTIPQLWGKAWHMAEDALNHTVNMPPKS